MPTTAASAPLLLQPTSVATTRPLALTPTRTPCGAFRSTVSALLLLPLLVVPPPRLLPIVHAFVEPQQYCLGWDSSSLSLPRSIAKSNNNNNNRHCHTTMRWFRPPRRRRRQRLPALYDPSVAASSTSVVVVHHGGDRETNNHSHINNIVVHHVSDKPQRPQKSSSSSSSSLAQRVASALTPSLVHTDAASATTTATTTTTANGKTIALHWIILVHGWLGNSAEMNALRDSLVQDYVWRSRDTHPSSTTTTTTTTTLECLIVHCATANDHCTTDGIAAGGARLAAEVNHLLGATHRHVLGHLGGTTMPTIHTSLSMVGNSLGGLYSRYALAEMDGLWGPPPPSQQEDAPSRYVQPKVFATVATPHLGVGHGHTYLRIPRWMERGIARGLLAQTGTDLFLADQPDIWPPAPPGHRVRVAGTLVHALAHDVRFGQPLRQFARRLAYANAYGTDFQVPTATAAFVCPNDNDDDDDLVAYKHAPDQPPSASPRSVPHRVVATAAHDETGGMIALRVETVTTASTTTGPAPATTNQPGTPPPPPDDTLSEMAYALDEMGWTKVFCDLRPHLTAIPVWRRRRRQQADTRVARARVGDHVTSADLHQEFVDYHRHHQHNHRWHFPAGHALLIANSKSKIHARMNAAGKPVVDRLARDVLDGILNDDKE